MILSTVRVAGDPLVEQYLAEQSDLSAVERFARRHDAELDHQQARSYRDLMPATAPAPGQQYAFEVDLDTCTGCKACVAACHSLNGLDEGETWRSVTVLHGKTATRPWRQTVTAACHHCLEPACLAGCPVDAYEKDPVTGIVFHLDDQCIGCSYCTLTCPYEVPVYNPRRGIVRKCDMCRDRLAVGEAPACAQACPNNAIRISVVDVEAVRARSRAERIPGAPPSWLTSPSSIYRSAKRHDEVTVAAPVVAPHARSHLPLVVMLVLTQLAVGAFVTDLVLRVLATGPIARVPSLFDSVLTLVVGAVALGASLFHLGRPRYAYRAVIGLGHSWLSREVVCFAAFTAMTASYGAAIGLGILVARSPLATALGAAVAVVGTGGVACSVRVYVATRRPAWRTSVSGPKFAFTTVVTGLGAILWAALASSMVTSGAHDGRALVASGRAIPLLLAALVALELGWELAVARRLVGRPLPHGLRRRAGARIACAVAGGIAAPLVLAASLAGRPPTGLALALWSLGLLAVVAGELLERTVYFDAAGAPR